MQYLGGGNSNMFGIFTPDPWGRWTHFEEHIFSDGWVSDGWLIFFKWVGSTTDLQGGPQKTSCFPWSGFGTPFSWPKTNGCFLGFVHPTHRSYFTPVTTGRTAHFVDDWFHGFLISPILMVVTFTPGEKMWFTRARLVSSASKFQDLTSFEPPHPDAHASPGSWEQRLRWSQLLRKMREEDGSLPETNGKMIWKDGWLEDYLFLMWHVRFRECKMIPEVGEKKDWRHSFSTSASIAVRNVSYKWFE